MSYEKQLLQNLYFAKDGGEVRRFHTFPCIGTDTVAHHSFGVAWLCVALCGGASEVSKRLLLAALSHDLAEHKIGDVRADAKKQSPTLKNELDKLEETELAAHGLNFDLNEEEQIILKLADNFDGLMFALKEIKMGNRTEMMVLTFRNYTRYLREMLETYEAAPPFDHDVAVLLLADIINAANKQLGSSIGERA